MAKGKWSTSQRKNHSNGTCRYEVSEKHKPAIVKQYMIGKIRRPKIKYMFEACCTVNTSEIGIRGFCSGG